MKRGSEIPCLENAGSCAALWSDMGSAVAAERPEAVGPDQGKLARHPYTATFGSDGFE